MTPCVLCTNEYEKLMEKRTYELERVLIEHIRDGYEDPLPDTIHDEILKETIAETRRQKKIHQKNRKVKNNNMLNDSRLHRVKLITKTNLVFTQEWRKNQQQMIEQNNQEQQGFNQSNNSNNMSNNSLNEEDYQIKSQQIDNLLLKPKIQSINEKDAHVLPSFSTDDNTTNILMNNGQNNGDNQNHNHNHQNNQNNNNSNVPFLISKKTPSSSALLLTSKIARRFSSISSKSKSNLRLFASTDPILSIRPLENISYCCIIHLKWFENWKRYVQSGHFEDIEYPVLEPGPITNYMLLKNASKYHSLFKKSTEKLHISKFKKSNEDESSISSPQSNLKSPIIFDESLFSSTYQITNNLLKRDLHYNYDYVVVSPNVWKVLHEIYGGGPPIYREDINVYSKEYFIKQDH